MFVRAANTLLNSFDEKLFSILSQSRRNLPFADPFRHNDQQRVDDITLRSGEVFFVDLDKYADFVPKSRRELDLLIPKLSPLPINQIAYTRSSKKTDNACRIAIARSKTVEEASSQLSAKPGRIVARDGSDEFVFTGRTGFIHYAYHFIRSPQFLAPLGALWLSTLISLYSARIIEHEAINVSELRQELHSVSARSENIDQALASLKAIEMEAAERVLEDWFTATSATVQRIEVDDAMVRVSGYVREDEGFLIEQQGGVLIDERRPGWRAYTLTSEGR